MENEKKRKLTDQEIAAAAKAIEDADVEEALKLQVAKEALKGKLIHRASKRRFQEEQKARRDITDKVKNFAEPEKETLAAMEKEYQSRLKDAKKEYERRLQEVKTEYNGILKAIEEWKQSTGEDIREDNKKRYKDAETKLQKLMADADARFEGFKLAFESATLEDLQEMWGETSHGTEGTAEASA